MGVSGGKGKQFSLSLPQRLPMGNFLNNIDLGRHAGNNGKMERAAKKPSRSKQHERGLCGGQSHSPAKAMHN